jgi:hypothetical protein
VVLVAGLAVALPRLLFLLSGVFSSALFSPVSFVPSVNLVLPSLQQLCGGVGGGGVWEKDDSDWKVQ